MPHLAVQGLDEQDNAGVIGVRQVQSILATVVAATCVTHRGHFTSPKGGLGATRSRTGIWIDSGGGGVTAPER
jgi:hypothetical protein